jgi:hypothetical protein
MATHKSSLETMTAVWLLPIVSTIVAAATGGIVAEVIPSSDQALITLITSYVLWATGVPLTMCVLVIYFLRLTTQSLPPRAAVVSTFLPLGPLGQGGFGIMQLGKVAMKVFPQTHTLPNAINPGEILYILGFFIGIIMWGFGLVWMCFAISTIVRSRHFPFNMGWWGFTFPLGVYTVCTTTLAKELPSTFFIIMLHPVIQLTSLQLRGLPVAPGTIGLMAKDLKSIDMVFRALLECAPWHQDHNVIEMLWRTEKEFWDMCQEREDYRQAYANYWTQMGSQTASKRPVDGIILPVSPTTAVREGEFRYFAYSAIANLMDYPPAVFPVVMEEDEDDSEEVANSEKPLSKLDSLVQKSCKFEVEYTYHDQADFGATVREEDAKGVPVCLQVMCTRLQEERVLALAQVIDETLRAHAESA